MRTTIDMPDDLLERTRLFLARRNMTFRALVIDAVERALADSAAPFQLRDESAGVAVGESHEVSTETINRAIGENRAASFRL